MSQLEKLLEKIKNNPRQVRFAELDKILIRFGFIRRQPQGGSSHYIYSKGSKQISVPHAQPHIKAIYVERALELLEGEMDDNE